MGQGEVPEVSAKGVTAALSFRVGHLTNFDHIWQFY